MRLHPIQGDTQALLPHPTPRMAGLLRVPAPRQRRTLTVAASRRHRRISPPRMLLIRLTLKAEHRIADPTLIAGRQQLLIGILLPVPGDEPIVRVGLARGSAHECSPSARQMTHGSGNQTPTTRRPDRTSHLATRLPQTGHTCQTLPPPQYPRSTTHPPSPRVADPEHRSTGGPANHGPPSTSGPAAHRRAPSDHPPQPSPPEPPAPGSHPGRTRGAAGRLGQCGDQRSPDEANQPPHPATRTAPPHRRSGRPVGHPAGRQTWVDPHLIASSRVSGPGLGFPQEQFGV